MNRDVDDYADFVPPDFGDEIETSRPDDEAYVITAAVAILEQLSVPARERVLRYLLDRFVAVPKESVKRELPDAALGKLHDELRRLVAAGVIAGPTPLIVPARSPQGGGT